jgi:7-hydroxymethyl chlorophyll a reductase
MEFAKYSIDYHYIRNFLSVQRNWPKKRAEMHIPEFAKRIVAEYDGNGQVTKRIALQPKK